MKTKSIALLLLSGLSLALASSVSFAAKPEGPPPGERGPRPPLPIIVALDADENGIISAQEIAAATTALQRLDANGDGQLTPDEYLPARPEGNRRGPPPARD